MQLSYRFACSALAASFAFIGCMAGSHPQDAPPATALPFGGKLLTRPPGVAWPAFLQQVSSIGEVLGIDHMAGLVAVVENGPHEFAMVRGSELALDARYKNPDEIQAWAREVVLRYPERVTALEIGKSGEGRPILALRVTNESPGPKKAVLIDAMHHAREVMTPEVAIDIVERLAAGKVEDNDELLNRLVVWVVPMVNPDGNVRVWNQDNMWRKNARGVDVNRNYASTWKQCNGSSGQPHAQDYRGEASGSEPETKVMQALADRIRPHTYLSFHSFSEIVILPYGCPGKRSPNERSLNQWGLELAAQFVREDGRGSYEAGKSYELLYPTDGASIDHVHKQYGSYAAVVELNSVRTGFQPPWSKRDETVAGARPGWTYALRFAAGVLNQDE